MHEDPPIAMPLIAAEVLFIAEVVMLEAMFMVDDDMSMFLIALVDQMWT